MKFLTLTSVLAVAIQPLFAGEFIRQQQLSSGLTRDHYVTPNEGSSWSPIALAEGGSRFTLYAQGTGPDTHLYKLDETTLGTDFPSVNMTVSSEDPHFPPRTRADKPFTLTLETKAKGVAASKSISISHEGTSYDPALHAPHANTPVKKFGWWQLPSRGTHKASLFSRLPSPDTTEAEGKETFTAYAQKAAGTEWLPLKTASIQVWPVARASITGLKSGTTISDTSAIKSVNILCQNLYPDSVTYAQIYHGEAKLGTRGAIMRNTVIRFDTIVPQDQTIPLGDWTGSLADGKYTLEILTITPFNQRKPERLSYVTFVLDRGMHAPGMVDLTP